MNIPVYRKIIEKQLKRKLTRFEHIHHIDGNQHNNSKKNLKLLSPKQHARCKKIVPQQWETIIKDILDSSQKDNYNEVNIALSLFFTSRQKQILFRKFYGYKLSKTEGEYYSRIIKKKIKAIANPSLYRAVSIMAMEIL